MALVLDEQRLVLTDWIVDELHEVVGRKRPDLLVALDALLAGIDYELAAPGSERPDLRSQRSADP